MRNIDIKELENIKEELETLDMEDHIYVNENGFAKYVLMPVEYFDILEDYRQMIENTEERNGTCPQIRIMSNDLPELSYDEYETIKKQLNDLFDQSFKPKADKLN